MYKKKINICINIVNINITLSDDFKTLIDAVKLLSLQLTDIGGVFCLIFECVKTEYLHLFAASLNQLIHFHQRRN